MFQIDNMFFGRFARPDALAELADGLETSGHVVFCDVAPTPGLVELVRNLRARGTAVAVYDHHWSDRTAPFYDELSDMGVMVRAGDRREFPSTARLVDLGVAATGAATVVADMDLDGLLSAARAAGLDYPAMLTDADILDGPRASRHEAGLSPLGRAAHWATIAARGERELADVFRLIREDLISKSGEDVAPRLASLAAAGLESASEAHRLAATASMFANGRIAVAYPASDAPYDVGTLAHDLHRRGVLVDVVMRDSGVIAARHGHQASVSVKKGERVDLRDFLPAHLSGDSPEEGAIVNVPFIGHFSPKVWAGFVLPGLEAFYKKGTRGGRGGSPDSV